jgi:hypothetical protein
VTASVQAVIRDKVSAQRLLFSSLSLEVIVKILIIQSILQQLKYVISSMMTAMVLMMKV